MVLSPEELVKKWNADNMMQEVGTVLFGCCLVIYVCIQHKEPVSQLNCILLIAGVGSGLPVKAGMGHCI